MNKMIAFFLALLFILPLIPEKHVALAKEAEDLSEEASFGEHIRLITDVTAEPMEIEVRDEMTGQIRTKTVMGSDFIPIRDGDYVNIICSSPLGTTDIRGGEFFLYFYDHDRRINWDILDYTHDRTGERNRVSVEYLKELNGFQFTNVPDGSYIRIAQANGYSCQLLIWDGCKTGYPVSGLATVFRDDGVKERLPADGSACIQVPKTALYLIAKPGYTFMNMFTSNGSVSQTVSSSDIRFPSQVIYLRNFGGAGRAKNIRIVQDYDYATGEYSRVMPNTDLSDAVIAVDEEFFQSTVSFSPYLNKVYSNIDACMDFEWEAKADILDAWGSAGHDGIVGMFRQGVTYHGIPYRSSWSTASYVGWHVSKQTFMNAANDPDSIFYHYSSSEQAGPYYSLVCSSFGTLVSGFSYPMANFSMMKDPQNHVVKTNQPVVGSLMTNGYGHTIVPIDHAVSPGGSSVYTLAEQVGPLTVLRSIYPDIVKTWKGVGLYTSYLSNYVYQVIPPVFSEIPYDITTFTIKNGSARPHRGDQSVYTSAMNVLINIKDPDATRLYYQKFDMTCRHGLPVSISACGTPQYINIEPGTTQVVLRSKTAKDGTYSGVPLEHEAIYGVWASSGNQQSSAPANVEYFEWHDLSQETIPYTIKDGALVTDGEFWYATTHAANETDYIRAGKTSGEFSIPYHAPVQHEGEKEAHSDYSDYAERAQIASPSGFRSFFRKGQFGAYVTGEKIISEEIS